MIDGLLPGLLDLAVRATVVLLLAWIAASLLRRASAATRHLVWSAAIAGVLALPLLGAALPAWRVRLMPPASAPEPVAQRRELPRATLPPSQDNLPNTAGWRSAAGAATTPQAAATSPVSAGPGAVARLTRIVRRWLTTERVLGVAWVSLALLLLARLAVANARVAVWRRSARAVEDGRWLALLGRLAREYGVGRPVVLLESEAADVPVTWGVIYPVVLLPAAANDWDDERRAAVLTHELAHVKRFDAFTQMLGQIALALLWFHPMVWLAVRRMRLEREHACDDFVLVAGARASRYADDLLQFARDLRRPAVPAAAALAMARRSELEGRLLAILDPATRRSGVRRARAFLLVCGVLALAAPLAAFRPARAERERPIGVRLASAGVPLDAMQHSVPKVTARPSAPSVAPRAVSPGAVSPGAASPGVVPPGVASSIASPSVSIVGEHRAARALVRIVSDTEPPPRPVDLETLIDVTRHAKKMTADHEKGRLLASIARHYVRNDELREAYLETVFSMTADHERAKALLALLERDSLPSGSAARVLRSATLMTSDTYRGQVLRRVGPSAFADSSVRRAYLDVVAAMASDTEKSLAVSSLIKSQPLSADMQLALLRATASITSSSIKANVLLLFVERHGIADGSVRRSFLKAAETLSSDAEYRRVVSAVMR